MSDVVPCGRCPSCLKRRQSGWIFRLEQELKVSRSAHFITLTYDDENLKCSPHGLLTLDKKDHQLFMKRLRDKINFDIAKTYGTTKKLANQFAPTLRYYSCGEYGETTLRPHYHSIIFNLPSYYLEPDKIDTKIKKTELSRLEKIWGKGSIHVGDVNAARS